MSLLFHNMKRILLLALAIVASAQSGGYWIFGFPQSSRAQAYTNMTSTVGCTSCTAYGFEFTPTEAVTITGFAIRQAGIAQANRWGAFAIYNGSTGAIVTSCTTAFSLGTAQARLTCPATGSLAVGTIYELVWVANSTVATISAANSGVDLGARLINDTTHRVYTVPGQANLSAAPTVSWQSNLGTRTATNIEPPHVFLY